MDRQMILFLDTSLLQYALHRFFASLLFRFQSSKVCCFELDELVVLRKDDDMSSSSTPLVGVFI